MRIGSDNIVMGSFVSKFRMCITSFVVWFVGCYYTQSHAFRLDLTDAKQVRAFSL